MEVYYQCIIGDTKLKSKIQTQVKSRRTLQRGDKNKMRISHRTQQIKNRK